MYDTRRLPLFGLSQRLVCSGLSAPTLALTNRFVFDAVPTTSCLSQISRNSGDAARSRPSSFQGLRLPVIFRIVLSEIPPERAAVGGGVMITTQQSALALGVATLGSLFLSVTEGAGMGTALTVTLLVRLAAIVLTGALSLRLPREVR